MRTGEFWARIFRNILKAWFLQKSEEKFVGNDGDNGGRYKKVRRRKRKKKGNNSNSGEVGGICQKNHKTKFGLEVKALNLKKGVWLIDRTMHWFKTCWKIEQCATILLAHCSSTHSTPLVFPHASRLNPNGKILFIHQTQLKCHLLLEAYSFFWELISPSSGAPTPVPNTFCLTLGTKETSRPAKRRFL